MSGYEFFGRALMLAGFTSVLFATCFASTPDEWRISATLAFCLGAWGAQIIGREEMR